jgi:hypothetical protein
MLEVTFPGMSGLGFILQAQAFKGLKNSLNKSGLSWAWAQALQNK